MATRKPAPDDITLVIGGRKLSGWTEMRVTRGIERCPNDFEVTMTERFPGEAKSMVVQPQDPCIVQLGTDTVITGYVDRFVPQLDAGSHLISVTGRSKSQDIVDCSAEWPGGKISGSSVLEIAQKLAKPYGIDVKAAADVGPIIPVFYLTLGETGYAIIERICRYRGLLIYDLPDGSVTLAQAGNGKMASGVKAKAGDNTNNMKRGRATYSADQRFSEYDAFHLGVDIFSDLGIGGNLIASVPDPGMKRHRLRDIIAEVGDAGDNSVAKQRATWEMNRRAGRSFKIEAEVDSWRDVNGTLWTPNYSIPVDVPDFKPPAGIDWLIGEVTYRKDSFGTRAELVLMPRGAFLPEPILLLPGFIDIGSQRP